MTSRFAILLGWLALCAGVALGDEVFLTTGRSIKGKVIEDDGDQVVVRTRDGKVTLPRRIVERIELSDEGEDERDEDDDDDDDDLDVDDEEQGATERLRPKGAGFSIQLYEGIEAVEASLSVPGTMISLEQGGRAVAKLISRPRAPWVTREQIEGDHPGDWSRSSRIRHGEEISFSFPAARHWVVYEREGVLQVVIETDDRLIQLRAARQSLRDERFVAMINSFTSVRARRYRSAIVQRQRLGDKADDPPPTELLEQIQAEAQTLSNMRQGIPKPIARGIAALREGKLDQAEAWMLLDHLETAVEFTRAQTGR